MRQSASATSRMSEEEIADRELGTEEPVLPPGNIFLLNSHSTNLQHSTEMLGLPTKTSVEELCQLIEGKLLDFDHKPQNVRVVLHEVKSMTVTILQLSLLDMSSVFQKASKCIQALQQQLAAR